MIMANFEIICSYNSATDLDQHAFLLITLGITDNGTALKEMKQIQVYKVAFMNDFHFCTLDSAWSS